MSAKKYSCGNCSITFPTLKDLGSHGEICLSFIDANSAEAVTLFRSGDTITLARAQPLQTVLVGDNHFTLMVASVPLTGNAPQWSTDGHDLANHSIDYPSHGGYSNFPAEFVDDNIYNNNFCFQTQDQLPPTPMHMFDAMVPDNDPLSASLTPSMQISTNQIEEASTKQKINSTRCYGGTSRPKFKVQPVQPSEPGHQLPKRFKVKCPICEKILWRTNVYEHMSIHTGEMPYKCSQCSKVFRHYTSFKDHLNKHNGKLKYICPMCGWTGMSNLRRHIRNQHKNRSMVEESQLEPVAEVADDSNELFINEPACTSDAFIQTDNHMGDEHHRYTRFDKIALMKKFERLKKFADMKLALWKRPKIECDMCSAVVYRHNLGTHRRIHMNVYPYQCNICRKRFRHINGIKYHHKVVHKNESIVIKSKWKSRTAKVLHSKAKICMSCGVYVFLSRWDKHIERCQNSLDQPCITTDPTIIIPSCDIEIGITIESVLNNISNLADEYAAKLSNDIQTVKDSLRHNATSSNKESLQEIFPQFSKLNSFAHDHGFYVSSTFHAIEQKQTKSSASFASTSLHEHNENVVVSNCLKYKCLSCDEGFYDCFQLIAHNNAEH